MTNYKEIITEFKDKRVLVIGDVMIDQYSYGIVDRISPEAPVPIVHIAEECFVLGGAGNVSLNLIELGAQVSLVSVAGDDIFAAKLDNLLTSKSSLHSQVFKDSGRQTTVKQRLLAGGQQLLRVDSEDTHYLSQDLENKVLAFIDANADKHDCICISDYAKGLVTKKIVARACEVAAENNVPLIVDTKPKHFEFYKNCTILTPNEHEVMTTYPSLSYKDAAQKLSIDTASPVLITRGAAGMSYIEQEAGEVFDLPSFATEVIDVSGAGDTVVAVTALALAVGADIKTAAYLSSKAAAVAVSKQQTSAVSPEELTQIV